MRLLIDVTYLVISPILLLYILVRSRLFTRRRYRAGLIEKFGGVKSFDPDRQRLVVHAVSVGEVRTALPLVHELRRRYPGWQIVLTTSTDTGHEAALMGLRGDGDVPVVYFPLDASWFVRRWLRAVHPDVVLLVELELWPNFLLSCRRRGVPVFVANGRLTERSHARYRAAGPLGRFLFSLPEAFGVQNEAYAARFISLGVPRERVTVLGNLKFDVSAPETTSDEETLRVLRWSGAEITGHARPIFVAACTHPGEEAIVLEVAAAQIARYPELRIVLAPRHIERAARVLDEARAAGLGKVEAWSSARDAVGNETDGPARIVVVDGIGELDRFYSIADVVLVGGSLVSRGGHNMLEPARHGKAILFGGSVYNFEDVAALLLDREAAVSVADSASLHAVVTELLDDPEKRGAMGRRALGATRELRGALGRHVEWLHATLSGGDIDL